VSAGSPALGSTEPAASKTVGASTQARKSEAYGAAHLAVEVAFQRRDRR